MDIPINAADLADEIGKTVEYMQKYRDKRIRIEYTEIAADADEPKNPVTVTHGIEGTVVKVMSLPPGFILDDAVEFVNSEKQTLDDVPPGSVHNKQKGEMFIAFDLSTPSCSMSMTDAHNLIASQSGLEFCC